MSIKTGTMIYLDNKGNYNLSLGLKHKDRLNLKRIEELRLLVSELEFKDNKFYVLNGEFEIPENILNKCFQIYNKIREEEDQWPEDEWEFVDDSSVDKNFDLNIYKPDPEKPVGKIVLYPTYTDKKGNLQTDYDHWKTILIVAIRNDPTILTTDQEEN